MGLKDKLRIATRYYVVDGYGVPCGPMMDFYNGEKSMPTIIARNPYPFKRGQGNGFEELEHAEKALADMIKHVEAVNSLPVNQRIGSSKWWEK